MAAVARSMELLGVRWLSLGLARLFGQPHLPKSTATPDRSWSKEKLLALRQIGRYYALGHTIRLVFALPLAIALFEVKSIFVFGLFAFLVVFHAVSVLVELYRLALIGVLFPRAENLGEEVLPSNPALSKEHGYFSPKKFETLRFYRRIGMEWAQGRVLWYDGWAKQSSRYLEAPTRDALSQFEESTRMAELTHLILSIPSVLALVALAWNGSWWWFIAAVVLWFDSTLVLLQRYNRVRLMAAINLMDRRAQRAGGVRT